MLKLSEWIPRFKLLNKTEQAAYAEKLKGASIKGFIENPPATWYVCQGDLHIAENVENDIDLIVEGDLAIQGFYDDSQVYAGSLVCLGHMQAQHVLSWGAIHVVGELIVEGLIFTTYNDYTFEVGKGIQARVLLVDGKAATYPQSQVELWYNSWDTDLDLPSCVELAQQLFVEEVLKHEVYWDTDDGQEDVLWLPDFVTVRDRLYKGQPIFLQTN